MYEPLRDAGPAQRASAIGVSPSKVIPGTAMPHENLADTGG
ncbi:hypothetical protein [Rhodococcus marinonascens]|nr:hypothetical protein [Rhodococcus marinonascens]